MSLKLRPGVYAAYEVSSSSANDAESALVGIAAAAQKGEAARIHDSIIKKSCKVIQ